MGAELGNVITIGVTAGCVYALIGIGFVLIYRATGVVSFAQGGFMTLGGLIFGSALAEKWNLYLALAVMAAALALFGAVIYRVIFARIVGGDPFITSVCTVGLATVMFAGASLKWGPSTIVFPQQLGYSRHKVGFLTFNPVQLFTIATTVVVFIFLMVLLLRTLIGLKMRAVASDARLAAHTGVRVVRVSSLAWALGGITGGLAAAVFLLGGQTDPGSIYALGLVAFPAVILGGLDSIPGTLVGGILIGLVQSVTAQYAGSKWQDMAAYGVLLLVLLTRPQGLFGNAQVVRL